MFADLVCLLPAFQPQSYLSPLKSLQRPEISPGRKDSREITGIKAECSQALPVLMPKRVKRVNDFW